MDNPLAVVTGASTGIGFELARCCADAGFDLLIVADEPEIEEAARSLGQGGRVVQSLEADLATQEGVDKVVEAVRGRQISVLCANAGRGLGRGFLDQDWNDIRRVIDTNVTGTVYLIHRLGNAMRAAGQGRILITGSIAGFMPGTFQAVYNASKAFLDSFAAAIRNEMKDSGVTVSCLMPGATETEFFRRADLMDTKIGVEQKMSAADVAGQGFETMMNGEASVVTGFKNKMQVAMSKVMGSETLAEKHRGETEPGTAKKAS